MKENVEKELKKYLDGKEFQEKFDGIVKKQVETLVSDAKKKAKFWSWCTGGIFVTGLVAMFLSSFVQLKKNEADIYKQYVEASQLLLKVSNTVDKLKSFEEELNPLKTKVDKAIEDTSVQIESFEKKTSLKMATITTSIDQCKTDIDNLRISSKQLKEQIVEHKKTISNSSAVTKESKGL